MQTHFKPVVKLTEQKDQKTGDEDEDEKLKMRVKFYRYFTETKEYRERGTGDLKFLQHRETKKTRIVMWRAQVHKMCANHFGKSIVASSIEDVTGMQMAQYTNTRDSQSPIQHQGQCLQRLHIGVQCS